MMKYETPRMEVFKSIEGYEDYLISDEGRICSKKRKAFLMPHERENECPFVFLDKPYVWQLFYVDRLVAKAFIPNPYNLPLIKHKDGNKKNNCVDNLEWCDAENDFLRDVYKRNDYRGVYCYELNKIFESQRAAARELGLHHSGISACCRGKQKTTGGYHFNFFEGV